MRKTILTVLGLAASLAGVAAAQQPGGDMPSRDRREQRGPGEGFERRGGPPAGFLLRGITLTDAQQAQLKELRKAQHEKMEANREQMRTQRDELRAARQRGDTAAVQTIMQRNRDAMAKEREQHIAAIRGILTAEQRTQFDKNLAELKEREQERGKRFGQRSKRVPGGGRLNRAG